MQSYLDFPSFPQHVREIVHVAVCISLFLLLIIIPLCEQITIYSPVDRYLDCFHLRTILNKAAVDIGTHLSWAGQEVGICSALVNIAKQFSKMFFNFAHLFNSCIVLYGFAMIY